MYTFKVALPDKRLFSTDLRIVPLHLSLRVQCCENIHSTNISKKFKFHPYDKAFFEKKTLPVCTIP